MEEREKKKHREILKEMELKKKKKKKCIMI